MNKQAQRVAVARLLPGLLTVVAPNNAVCWRATERLVSEYEWLAVACLAETHTPWGKEGRPAWSDYTKALEAHVVYPILACNASADARIEVLLRTLGMWAGPTTLAKVDRPWRDYPVGTKAHSCLGGYWVKITQTGWQFNGRAHSGMFHNPGGEAQGACIELPMTAVEMEPTGPPDDEPLGRIDRLRRALADLVGAHNEYELGAIADTLHVRKLVDKTGSPNKEDDAVLNAIDVLLNEVRRDCPKF